MSPMLFQSTRNGRLFSALGSQSCRNEFTHCVIGGGVVGLSIARQLAQRPSTSTLILERHGSVGTETSSRNSEVIHAGLYYPSDSLKTKLCIEGSLMLYDYCRKRNIPHKVTGKWIVAQNSTQRESLERVYKHAKNLDVPMNWLSPLQTLSREPNIRATAGALESPRTGIVDSHALTACLFADFEELGGDVAFHTTVTNIDAVRNGYKIKTGGVEATEITADVVINAGGLGAIDISNYLLPESRQMKPYYCKGTYFSYSSPHPKVGTLIYPTPVTGLGGLGTHLTLDMTGRIRFGPDVEWVDNPSDLNPNESRREAAILAIKEYLPAVDETALMSDYSGIRPKIKPPTEGGVGQVDFIIREEDGYPGFVNLLGIESPGLTSSIAIGKYVDSMLYG
ncbi:FAD dependent oxidoreductase [Geopyxis carbonaria]|nr:FAD dependent oxidoreductase [Geopyxis carbonaria]